jgi:hypothetical protein
MARWRGGSRLSARTRARRCRARQVEGLFRSNLENKAGDRFCHAVVRREVLADAHVLT